MSQTCSKSNGVMKGENKFEFLFHWRSINRHCARDLLGCGLRETIDDVWGKSNSGIKVGEILKKLFPLTCKRRAISGGGRCVKQQKPRSTNKQGRGGQKKTWLGGAWSMATRHCPGCKGCKFSFSVLKPSLGASLLYENKVTTRHLSGSGIVACRKENKMSHNIKMNGTFWEQGE